MHVAEQIRIGISRRWNQRRVVVFHHNFPLDGQRRTISMMMMRRRLLIRVVVKVDECIRCCWVNISVCCRLSAIVELIAVTRCCGGRLLLSPIGENLFHMLRIDDVHDGVGEMDAMAFGDVKEDDQESDLLHATGDGGGSHLWREHTSKM